MTTQPVPASSEGLREVRVTGAKRKFVFTLESSDASDSFLSELRAQVEGKAIQDMRSKKRKIRKKLADTHSSGFVPVVNTLKSPVKAVPLTPTKRRLSDGSIASPRLAPPLPFSVNSVSSPAAAASSPLQSPFRSPFRKRPPPRTASPMAPLVPKSPSSASPRPREFLSPVRARTERTPSTARLADGKRPPLTPPVGIANKRVRSLQRMLDDSSAAAEPPALRSLTPPVVRSPFFPEPTPRSDRNAYDGDDKENAATSVRSSPSLAVRSPLRPRADSNLRLPPRVPSPSLGPSAAPTPSRKATHGLLNLGNYCYMNAILQSLAAIPEFVSHLERDEWLLKVIRRHCKLEDEHHAPLRSLEQMRSVLNEWRQRDPATRLAVAGKLGHLLQQIVNGSETTINPEPLKITMGRKNAMFATHLQQDAHEFLLQLVNEYEKELVAAVRGVSAELDKESEASTAAAGAAEQPSPEPAPPRRVSLLNFFRPEPKSATPTSTAAPAAAVPSSETSPTRKDTEELVSQLFPAQCFRAELTRTLTCRACGYHRDQVETFSDFSLDLPFVPPPSQPPAPEPSPTPSTKRCHCGEDAKIVQEPSGQRFFCCSRSACSLRDAVPAEETAALPVAETADSAASDATTVETDSEPSLQFAAPRVPTFQSIPLQELLQKQFESEVLELTCEKCSSGREAVSEYRVKSLPRVLVLHLKRFEVSPLTGTLYKRCDAVEAPVMLDPAREIHGQATDASSSFRLQSVVHHLGRSIDEGHYVADVRDRRGDWRRRNDATETVVRLSFLGVVVLCGAGGRLKVVLCVSVCVVQVSEDLALRATRSQESCYMLFYVRETATDAAQDKENAPAASTVAQQDEQQLSAAASATAAAPSTPVRQL
ncbi:hypothetical protein PINS_up001824 [Pythium insidiosum]|nr:hypothetical protein PINS_up001824 [Pythium insidiosum]